MVAAVVVLLAELAVVVASVGVAATAAAMVVAARTLHGGPFEEVAAVGAVLVAASRHTELI